MKSKSFWKNSFFALVVKNILIAGVLLFVLGWLALLFTDKYTQHGAVCIVPDVRGLYVEEAEIELKNSRLFLEVVDSIYVAGKPLGSVIEQIPAAASKVKPNRAVYLIINSKQIKKVPLPDILETSYRQAEATLRSLGMSVQNIEYIPSEYRDLVLAVKMNGVEIASGTRVADGSAVTLVVGQGVGAEHSVVPSVRGMSVEQARETLLAAGFVVGGTDFTGSTAGGAAYITYRQQPQAGVSAAQGTRVNLWLSTDKTMLDRAIADETRDEEFF